MLLVLQDVTPVKQANTQKQVRQPVYLVLWVNTVRQVLVHVLIVTLDNMLLLQVLLLVLVACLDLILEGVHLCAPSVQVECINLVLARHHV